MTSLQQKIIESSQINISREEVLVSRTTLTLYQSAVESEKPLPLKALL